MAGFYQWKDAVTLMEQLNFGAAIKHYASVRRISLFKLNSLIGKSDNFIGRKIKNGQIDVPLLYCLSLHLQVNLFEPLLNAMPDNVRKTDVEKQLEAEKKALEQENEILKRENELMKAILKAGK